MSDVFGRDYWRLVCGGCEEKPRLRFETVSQMPMWVCRSTHRTGWGRTAFAAYLHWVSAWRHGT